MPTTARGGRGGRFAHAAACLSREPGLVGSDAIHLHWMQSLLSPHGVYAPADADAAPRARVRRWGPTVAARGGVLCEQVAHAARVRAEQLIAAQVRRLPMPEQVGRDHREALG